MITVAEIVKRYLKDNGADGLYNPESECGCDGSAPCGEGPYSNCEVALRLRDESGELLYFAIPQTYEEIRTDNLNYCRNLRQEEVEFWRRFMKIPQNHKVKNEN
jgi:hypothetical protein